VTALATLTVVRPLSSDPLKRSQWNKTWQSAPEPLTDMPLCPQLPRKTSCPPASPTRPPRPRRCRPLPPLARPRPGGTSSVALAPPRPRGGTPSASRTRAQACRARPPATTATGQSATSWTRRRGTRQTSARAGSASLTSCLPRRRAAGTTRSRTRGRMATTGEAVAVTQAASLPTRCCACVCV